MSKEIEKLKEDNLVLRRSIREKNKVIKQMEDDRKRLLLGINTCFDDLFCINYGVLNMGLDRLYQEDFDSLHNFEDRKLYDLCVAVHYIVSELTDKEIKRHYFINKYHETFKF